MSVSLPEGTICDAGVLHQVRVVELELLVASQKVDKEAGAMLHRS